MTNLTISKKIILTVLISIAGMMIIAVSSYVGLSSIGAEIEEIAEYQVPIQKATIELEKDILKQEILAYELIIASKDIKSSRFDKAVQAIEEMELKTEKAIVYAEELVQKAIDYKDEEKSKNKYKHFMEELKVLEKEQQIFKKELSICVDDLKNARLEKAEKDKVKLIKELKLMGKNIEILLTEFTELLEKSTLQAEKGEKKVQLIIEIISFIVIILSVVTSYFLIKTFKKKIETFKSGVMEFFEFLNRKRKDVNELDASGDDEISHMAKAINENIRNSRRNLIQDRSFLENLKDVASKVQEGLLTTRVTAKVENKNLIELRENLNSMLETLQGNVGKDTNKIIEVLEKLSKYDFEKQVLDAKGKIDKSLNEVIDLITTMLVNNKTNGLTLDDSANELLENVDKLNISSNEARTNSRSFRRDYCKCYFNYK